MHIKVGHPAVRDPPQPIYACPVTGHVCSFVQHLNNVIIKTPISFVLVFVCISIHGQLHHEQKLFSFVIVPRHNKLVLY